MERLIDNALIYGGLMQVRAPHLVERYNMALREFGLPPTARAAFVVDAAGYSPQIAADLDDENYLDPHGVNRRFIILSPEQETLPVISSSFSSTAELMARFYRANAESLKVLTLKDVVLGEIEDSTHQVEDIFDILSIRHVEFKLKTSQGLLEKAERLAALVARLENEPDGWMDGDLLGEILTLSRLCGDTRYNNLVPRRTTFDLRSFWTRHFNGLFVFKDDEDEAVVVGTDNPLSGDVDGSDHIRFIHIDDHEEIYEFLSESGRLEPLNLNWLGRSGLIDLRTDLLVRARMFEASEEADILGADEMALRNWALENLDDLSRDGLFPFLTDIKKSLLNRTSIDLHDADPDLMLQVLRAAPGHPDQILVNRLLANYAPYDFVTRYIVDKQAFYDAYAAYPPAQRDLAVHMIKSVYLPDKQAVWQRLFEEPEEKADVGSAD